MKVVFAVLSLIFGASMGLRACDICGCYTPRSELALQVQPLVPTSWGTGWFAAVGEQFTYFGTLQLDGREVSNPTGQYEASSITQLVAGDNINDRFSLRLNIPLIYREFKRPEGFAIDRGTESGLGDISLLLSTVFFRYSSPGQRTFEFEGKNPIAIDHEPDFTFSAIFT